MRGPCRRCRTRVGYGSRNLHFSALKKGGAVLNLLMKIATLDVSLESVSTASGDNNAHAWKIQLSFSLHGFSHSKAEGNGDATLKEMSVLLRAFTKKQPRSSLELSPNPMSQSRRCRPPPLRGRLSPTRRFCTISSHSVPFRIFLRDLTFLLSATLPRLGARRGLPNLSKCACPSHAASHTEQIVVARSMSIISLRYGLRV